MPKIKYLLIKKNKYIKKSEKKKKYENESMLQENM